MIKLKKLLAGVIGAAMMLTSATALASEVQTPDVTIDTTKTGSLTIHKYEYNGTDIITMQILESEDTGFRHGSDGTMQSIAYVQQI